MPSVNHLYFKPSLERTKRHIFWNKVVWTSSHSTASVYQRASGVYLGSVVVAVISLGGGRHAQACCALGCRPRFVRNCRDGLKSGCIGWKSIKRSWIRRPLSMFIFTIFGILWVHIEKHLWRGAEFRVRCLKILNRADSPEWGESICVSSIIRLFGQQFRLGST